VDIKAPVPSSPSLPRNEPAAVPSKPRPAAPAAADASPRAPVPVAAGPARQAPSDPFSHPASSLAHGEQMDLLLTATFTKLLQQDQHPHQHPHPHSHGDLGREGPLSAAGYLQRAEGQRVS